MRKNIYIPDDKLSVFKEAEELFTEEKSISQLIIESLEKAIQDKKDLMKYSVFLLDDQGAPTKLIGEKIATYEGRYFDICELFYLKESRYFSNQDNPEVRKEDKRIIDSIEEEGLYGIKIGWNDLSTLNSKGFLSLDFFDHRYFEINAYQTKSDRIYLEMKECAPYKLCIKSQLIHISNIWKFIKSGDTGDIACLLSSGEDGFPLPEKFMEDIKKAFGDDFITQVIE